MREDFKQRFSNNNTKLITLVKLLTTNQIVENSTTLYVSRNSERLFGHAIPQVHLMIETMMQTFKICIAKLLSLVMWSTI